MNWKNLTLALLGTAMIMACKKDDETPITNSPPPAATSDFMVLVSNEGPFGSGTGSISQINLTSGEAYHDLFENSNNYPLGNVVQSANKVDDRLYIVVNNAQKIEVVDYPEFTSSASISGLSMPRYFAEYDGTGYVTDWGIDGVQIINLEANQISNSISTGSGPENMLVHDGYLYVANSGGFDTDNRVSVINLGSNSLETQIEVADNPQSMVIDGAGNIRVLCRGLNDWSGEGNDTAGALFTIDPNNQSVLSSFSFDSVDDHPSNLVSDGQGDKLYFLMNGNIYSFDHDATALPSEPLITGNFYALGFHAGAQQLLATDAADYQQEGTVHVFATSGSEDAVFDAGVIPSHILTY